MPQFNYEAIDTAGKSSSGLITARDVTEAAARVRAMGVYPVQIGAGRVEAGSNGNASATLQTQSGGSVAQVWQSLIAPKAAGAGSRRVGRLQVLLFTREMADLLDAGLPMDRAFSVLINQAEVDSVREMLTAMQSDIRSGKPLSESLAAFPREFSYLYVNMVRAGEVSGQLASVMARLADFMEKEAVRRSQIMAALSYPMVLITVATIAIIFLVMYVIPKLSAVFKDLGAALPLPTQLLLGVSTAVGHYWWAILIVVVGVVVGFRAWVSTGFGRKSFDAFRLSVPLFGKLMRKIISARFARTLGTLLAGGVPILQSMEISAAAVGNVVASDAITTAYSGVRQGETLHTSIEQTGVFLPVVNHMTAVGEETGRLPAMLIRTAETLDFEVDNAMRRLTSMVEPLIVVCMGGFVGFVVLSILLPILQINTLVH
ncbi:MAG: type II secretion system F family protein [Armatimonadetes bacterium]|nr:type II secretion system F family protein [Armatimonadota bacterium]MDE2207766.1 type II secretion system F family protein [Armatimonadota bacterium]